MTLLLLAIPLLPYLFLAPMAFLLLGVGVSATSFTLMNTCSYTVWPGVSSDVSQPMLAAGGFQLAPGQTNVLNPPAGWSGRFWARTGCNFDASGNGLCATGDCGGVLQCKGAGGVPPVTLAEFTLGAGGNQDFYDVSLVDGYNVPVLVTSSGGSGDCGNAGCTSNLNGACPSQLQMDNGGQVVACRSACDAFDTPQFCCTGAFSTPQTCGPNDYSKLFKSACPTAYSYAYDDPTSTFTCTGASAYTIHFCPSGTD